MAHVRDIMTTRLKLVHPGDNINTAAEEMKNFNIGALPVVDNDKVVGMLTDRDITLRVVAENGDPKTMTVRDVMSPDVTYCRENQDVGEVMDLMKKNRVRRVVVLNDQDKLAGIVSLGDLALSTSKEEGGDVLKEVSKPPKEKKQ